MIRVLLHNETAFSAHETTLVEIVQRICHDYGYAEGEVSLAIVDDQAIHELNRRHLQHDYPTDVLSFLLEQTADGLEGEVIVSADTASRVAADYGWSEHHELLLYCIHGTLHLVGLDDGGAEDRARMREREQYYLTMAGVGTGTPRPEGLPTVPREAST